MALIELFELLHTKWGYGHLDEVSALYGLMWNTPEAVLPVALGTNSIRLPNRGFQQLWQTIVEKEQLDVQLEVDIHYGNTGCQVFKRGGTKLERFLHKNQRTQRKLLNFEFWINGESKSAKI